MIRFLLVIACFCIAATCNALSVDEIIYQAGKTRKEFRGAVIKYELFNIHEHDTSIEVVEGYVLDHIGGPIFTGKLTSWIRTTSPESILPDEYLFYNNPSTLLAVNRHCYYYSDRNERIGKRRHQNPKAGRFKKLFSGFDIQLSSPYDLDSSGEYYCLSNHEWGTEIRIRKKDFVIISVGHANKGKITSGQRLVYYAPMDAQQREYYSKQLRQEIKHLKQKERKLKRSTHWTDAPEYIQTTEAFPDFTAKRIDNKDTIVLNQQKDTCILVYIFNVYCLDCKTTMLELDTLYKTFAGKPVKIYAISTDQGKDTVLLKIVQTLGISYPVLNFIHKDGVSFEDCYQYTYLLDRDKKVAHWFSHYSTRTGIEEKINELLK